MLAMRRSPRLVAMDFSNTQIVTMRRHDKQFRKLTSAFDFFSPDGMPLVWCLNLAATGTRPLLIVDRAGFTALAGQIETARPWAEHRPPIA